MSQVEKKERNRNRGKGVGSGKGIIVFEGEPPLNIQPLISNQASSDRTLHSQSCVCV